MNIASLKFPKNRLVRPAGVISALGVLLLLCGCQSLPTLPTSVQDFTPAYKPTNVYRRYSSLPPQLKRVAFLPLTFASSAMQAGAETLQPILFAELEKTKRFEVIPVSPDQIRQLTGQRDWKADDLLPPDIFERVREATGADAILFCELTRYQPYQPLAMGWKFCLVESPKKAATTTEQIKAQIYWSADEVLDAGDPAVANAARMYFMQHVHTDSPASDSSSMQMSPLRFGQYSLAALLATIPDRSVQIP